MRVRAILNFQNAHVDHSVFVTNITKNYFFFNTMTTRKNRNILFKLAGNYDDTSNSSKRFI